ncbi:MAG: biotin/lipoyl-containing protein [Bacillota bacterium]
MRKFRVKIDGEVFEVEVEEVGAQAVQTAAVPSPKKTSTAPSDIPQKKAVQPITAPATKKPEPTAPAKPAAGNGVVTAPIPGIVTEIKVAPGESVKRGQLLLLLEAMKMQNEILAPYDATVVEVAVSQGASVQTGDVLVKLDR